MNALGIDVGGSGIKGAPVDVSSGALLDDRFRLVTPDPSTPDAVMDVCAELVRHFNWEGPIGCTFPAVIKDGVAHTAANVDKSWIGANGRDLLQQRTGCPVTLLNDADAAGIAEMTFGAGRDERGVVFMLTFGTGIGTALFVNGQLMPNTELGHLEYRGKEAEYRASDRARSERSLSWEDWARRVNEYLDVLEALFWPDLFIIGGGVSKKHEKFLPLITTRARVVPAGFFNEAGIVGAALAASEASEAG
jgi:polyphosphate glucokinase